MLTERGIISLTNRDSKYFVTLIISRFYPLNTMSNLHIPIAVNRLTHELVNAKDVPNGLNCDCFCTMCKENLIAVNQEIKQRAHFRHSKNSVNFGYRVLGEALALVFEFRPLKFSESDILDITMYLL